MPIMPDAEKVELKVVTDIASRPRSCHRRKARWCVQVELELAEGKITSTPAEVMIRGTGPIPNPGMIEPERDAKARFRTRDGRIMELPGFPGPGQSRKRRINPRTLSSLNNKPDNYIDSNR